MKATSPDTINTEATAPMSAAPISPLEPKMARAKHFLEVKAKFDAGVECQWRNKRCACGYCAEPVWKDITRSEEFGWDWALDKGQEVRVKPEPGYRAWSGPSEVPVGAVIRIRSNPEAGKWLITACADTERGFLTGGANYEKGQCIKYAEALRDHEYSHDGELTWHRCGVLVPA